MGTRHPRLETLFAGAGRSYGATRGGTREGLTEAARKFDRMGAEGRAAHGVSYLRYGVDEGKGQIFCLVEAPDAEAANTVPREAHGLVADAVHRVQEGV